MHPPVFLSSPSFWCIWSTIYLYIVTRRGPNCSINPVVWQTTGSQGDLSFESMNFEIAFKFWWAKPVLSFWWSRRSFSFVWLSILAMQVLIWESCLFFFWNWVVLFHPDDAFKAGWQQLLLSCYEILRTWKLHRREIWYVTVFAPGKREDADKRKTSAMDGSELWCNKFFFSKKGKKDIFL